jgi:fibronectin-binding autotransporter adhesin
MLGGIVTGSGNEFLALPVSGTVLGGLSGLTANEWSRFYLSDSFGTASGSVIQALNYLSASLRATSGDVVGPGSSTDHAIARFDGTGGKTLQNTSQVTISDAGVLSSSVGATLGNLILNDDARSLTLSGTISSSAGATFLGPIISNGALSVSGTLTAATFSPASVSGAVKINVFTHKILSNNSIETSASIVAKTTISGAGAASFATLTTEEASITLAGVVSGAGAVQAKSLTTEEASISAAGVFTGSGGISGQSLIIANLAKVNSDGVVSSSAGATLGNLILNDDATSLQLSGALVAQSISSSVGSTLGNLILNDDSVSLKLSGSMTGSGLATFTNTSLAQGGGYKAAVIVSSSAISTAADAAAIPRMVIQGTDNLGNLADFMITVSGGILRADKLTDGTWPV